MTSRTACVFDTNSLISALPVRISITREAFDNVLDHYQILVSEATMEEFDDVASREKFASYLEEGERERLEELLYREATYVSVDVTVPKAGNVVYLPMNGSVNM